MKIGLLSDTHGHSDRTIRAAELLWQAGVGHVIHAGDIGSEAVLIELAAVFDPHDIPVTTVTGNVDLWRSEIEQFPETTCVSVARTARLELAGQRIGVIHGDDRQLLDAWLAAGDLDLLITGHTHVRDDRMAGSMRVINPGAVYRAATPGCATLDLSSGMLKYLDLAENAG